MIRKRQSSLNVVEAAYIRIENIFKNGVQVYLSTSGGKDSVALCHIVYDLILQGRIDPSLLTVIFMDEEAMYDDVIDIVKEWRVKFLSVGARFDWYCLEFRHFNCLNYLSADENFICWDSLQKDKWTREMPEFAITYHPLMKPRVFNYQTFSEATFKDGITLVGARAAESVQRLQIVSKIKSSSGIMKNGTMAWPIYDWTDKDVWLFIKENKISIPETYIKMYQVGTSISRLRISTFFATDTIGSLARMAETDPELMEKIMKREPNAYMVMIYWDSDMFGRKTKRTTNKIADYKDEEQEEEIDYQAKVFDIIQNPTKYYRSKQLLMVVEHYKTLIAKMNHMMTDKHYEEAYRGLIRGDTKKRTLRALYQTIAGDYRQRLASGKEE